MHNRFSDAYAKGQPLSFDKAGTSLASNEPMNSFTYRQPSPKHVRGTGAVAHRDTFGRNRKPRAAEPSHIATAIQHNTPETLVNDPRVKLEFGEERMILDDGLQPSMLCTKSGTLVVQSQLSKKPHPQERIFYPYASGDGRLARRRPDVDGFSAQAGRQWRQHRRRHRPATRRHDPGRWKRTSRRATSRAKAAGCCIRRTMTTAR